jgi:hypothetical protein
MTYIYIFTTFPIVIAINQQEAHNKVLADCKRQIAILGSEQVDNDLLGPFMKEETSNILRKIVIVFRAVWSRHSSVGIATVYGWPTKGSEF